MSEKLSDITGDRYIIADVSAPCEGCGKETFRWDTKYKLQVCWKCNSDEIIAGIAHHVMYPNE